MMQMGVLRSCLCLFTGGVCGLYKFSMVLMDRSLPGRDGDLPLCACVCGGRFIEGRGEGERKEK